jgi:methionyl-tRNA formyltransferase
VRIVFAGTPAVALPSLDALAASEHELVAVVTRPDAPGGRGRRLQPSPVAARADELGVEVLKPQRPREPAFQDRLRELAPDCCPVVAYGALVPGAALTIPRHGWVNLHFSLLPAWRGAAPVQHAVLAGDEVTGATTFQLVEELDAGPTYLTITEPIGAEDTSGALLARLAARGAELLVETLDGIAAGTLTPAVQPGDGVTLAPKLTVADAELRWDRPAVELDRLIRGCQPDPGAWTTFRGERFKIDLARPEPSSGLEPGRLVADKRSVRVGTGAGDLLLLQVQPPGRRSMEASAWARGVRFEADETLGS